MNNIILNQRRIYAQSNICEGGIFTQKYRYFCSSIEPFGQSFHCSKYALCKHEYSDSLSLLETFECVLCNQQIEIELEMFTDVLSQRKTIKRRHFGRCYDCLQTVVITSKRRRFNVMCLLGVFLKYFCLELITSEKNISVLPKMKGI